MARTAVVDLVASEEVRNFDQINVGDDVVARYALAFEMATGASNSVLSTGAARRRGQRLLLHAVVDARSAPASDLFIVAPEDQPAIAVDSYQ